MESLILRKVNAHDRVVMMKLLDEVQMVPIRWPEMYFCVKIFGFYNIEIRTFCTIDNLKTIHPVPFLNFSLDRY